MRIPVGRLKDILDDERRSGFGKCMEILQEWRKSVLESEER